MAKILLRPGAQRPVPLWSQELPLQMLSPRLRVREPVVVQDGVEFHGIQNGSGDVLLDWPWGLLGQASMKALGFLFQRGHGGSSSRTPRGLTQATGQSQNTMASILINLYLRVLLLWPLPHGARRELHTKRIHNFGIALARKSSL